MFHTEFQVFHCPLPVLRKDLRVASSTPHVPCDGEISAHDEEPTLTGESPEDLLRSIEIMLKDVKKNFSSFYPLVVNEEKILKYDKIKFAPLIDKDEELIIIKDLDDLIKKTDKNETN